MGWIERERGKEKEKETEEEKRSYDLRDAKRENGGKKREERETGLRRE